MFLSSFIDVRVTTGKCAASTRSKPSIVSKSLSKTFSQSPFQVLFFDLLYSGQPACSHRIFKFLKVFFQCHHWRWVFTLYVASYKVCHVLFDRSIVYGSAMVSLIFGFDELLVLLSQYLWLPFINIVQWQSDGWLQPKKGVLSILCGMPSWCQNLYHWPSLYHVFIAFLANLIFSIDLCKFWYPQSTLLFFYLRTDFETGGQF